jgi:hypothetical protein
MNKKKNKDGGGQWSGSGRRQRYNIQSQTSFNIQQEDLSQAEPNVIS